MDAGPSSSEDEACLAKEGGAAAAAEMRRDAGGAPSEPPYPYGGSGADAGSGGPGAGAGAGAGAVHAAFAVLGVGSLTPFNALINAAVFYRARLGGTPFAGTFGSAFPLAFTAANVAALVAALRAGGRAGGRGGGLAQASARVSGSLWVCGAVFCGLAVQALDASVAAAAVFWTTLAAAGILGGCCAYFSAAVVGLAARFPATCTQAVMAGQGVAGLGISLMALAADALSHAAGPAGEAAAYAEVRNGALAYFAVALAVVAACRLAFQRMLATPFAKGVLGEEAAPPGERTGHVGAPLLPSAPTQPGVAAGVDVDVEGMQAEDRLSAAAAAEEAEAAAEEEAEDEEDFGVGYQKLMWSIRWPAAAVFGVFAVTLSAFPAMTALVAPATGTVGPLARPGLFVNLGFVVFNAADLLGRVLAQSDGVDWERAFGKRIRLALYAAARVVLVPLLAACNVQCPGGTGAGAGTGVSFLAESNVPFFALMAIFGISNGMLSSQAMMLGPGLGQRLWGFNGFRERSGEIMVFSLTLGLAVGSLNSFLVQGVRCAAA